MGNEVTKNDLIAVNKRIDNACKYFNELKKQVEAIEKQEYSDYAELVSSVNNVSEVSRNNLSNFVQPVGKRLAALETRLAALEKK
jgi:archaellum component FlaC